MKIEDLISKYVFHDSLLERVSISQGEQTATLDIDFCNWQQADYTENKAETQIVQLVFRNVHEVLWEKHNINSDEILACRSFAANGNAGIEFVVENDGDGATHTIRITADSVEFLPK